MKQTIRGTLFVVEIFFSRVVALMEYDEARVEENHDYTT